MPHRVLRAVLLEILEPCCDAERAEQVADTLLAAGFGFPTLTVTDVRDLDKIPNGSAVIVGNPADPAAMPHVGVKGDHSITFTGDVNPWPFHNPNLAPPLPCTVLWMPGDQISLLQAVTEETP